VSSYSLPLNAQQLWHRHPVTLHTHTHTHTRTRTHSAWRPHPESCRARSFAKDNTAIALSHRISVTDEQSCGMSLDRLKATHYLVNSTWIHDGRYISSFLAGFRSDSTAYIIAYTIAETKGVLIPLSDKKGKNDCFWTYTSADYVLWVEMASVLVGKRRAASQRKNQYKQSKNKSNYFILRPKVDHRDGQCSGWQAQSCQPTKEPI